MSALSAPVGADIKIPSIGLLGLGALIVTPWFSANTIVPELNPLNVADPVKDTLPPLHSRVILITFWLELIDKLPPVKV
jgi:hypothetical protein